MGFVNYNSTGALIYCPIEPKRDTFYVTDASPQIPILRIFRPTDHHQSNRSIKRSEMCPIIVIMPLLILIGTSYAIERLQ